MNITKKIGILAIVLLLPLILVAWGEPNCDLCRELKGVHGGDGKRISPPLSARQLRPHLQEKSDVDPTLKLADIPVVALGATVRLCQELRKKGLNEEESHAVIASAIADFLASNDITIEQKFNALRWLTKKSIPYCLGAGTVFALLYFKNALLSRIFNLKYN